MTHGSLFSGIGGFDLAAEWMGWENVFHCEWNEFGQKVLKYYWPKAISYADITKTDFSIHRGTIDILTGGFPCQPYSLAGKRKGKEDARHLWPEMLRAIREIQPKYIVGENVLGLTNWNGGLVFNEVQIEMEAQGYEVQPFILPACSVNAPHRRERVWFIAKNTNENGWRGNEWEKESSERQQRNFGTGNYEPICANNAEVGIDANASGIRCNNGCYNWQGGLLQTAGKRQLSENKQKRYGWEFGTCPICSISTKSFTNTQSTGLQGRNRAQESIRPKQRSQETNWSNWPTQPPVCNGNDGIPAELDGITFPKWRNESIKAGGNAIVPQVAHQIFKAIEQYDNLTLAQN